MLKKAADETKDQSYFLFRLTQEQLAKTLFPLEGLSKEIMAFPTTGNIENIAKKYYADKYCTFKFTVSAMNNLISLILLANERGWYEELPKDMPILLVSGEDDPVGNYGKGVTEVYDKLKSNGFDAECILYKGARHEILNDFTYEQVRLDILNFADNNQL